MTRTGDVLSQLDLAAAGDDPLFMRVGPVALSIYCPEPLRASLMRYFEEVLTAEPGGQPVHLLPGQTLMSEPDWTDWAREPGKTGRKDAISPLMDGRLIQKVRSGVTFLQSAEAAVAFGPLDHHESTVINFINTQILNTCLRDGWHLCHAAAVRRGDRTLAISGLSGGGKSTSILRMMDIDGTEFLSNDRVLLRKGTPPDVLGIPKHPRINPGTILGNHRLHRMLSPERLAELEAMPPSDLWSLEDKHDLIISDVYGSDRIRFDGGLTDFWVLNWSHDSDEPARVTEVDLAGRPDLMRAIMKSPGPFYQHADGTFEPNGAAPDPAAYLDALQGVRVSEVSGRIDFDAVAEHGRRVLND